MDLHFDKEANRRALREAAQEKAATLAEAQAQLAVLETTRADWENLQTSPSASLVEEARRNLNAAKTASDTAAREARVAAHTLTWLEERLAEVRKRRGEMRWQQAADHEAFEQVARTLRIFTQEALEAALGEIEKARAAQEALRAAEAKRRAAPASAADPEPKAG